MRNSSIVPLYVIIRVSVRNFVETLCNTGLVEAQPQSIRVGYLYQDRLGRSASRVPFIRLAGQWLADAGFDEGDVLAVQVTSGEIRLLKENDGASASPGSKSKRLEGSLRES